jgi:DNA repair protein RecO (recombination protein O)
MNWQDEGLVLGARRHGETSVILELMTKAHGRHLGLVRGGVGRALVGVLQPGNQVEATWRARLENQLGAYTVEPLRARAARLIDHAYALHGVTHLCAMLRLLPERDPHGDLFEMAEVIADQLDSLRFAPTLMARFELALLAALGFGLDLDICALTGSREHLCYVSPKSGRAVSRDAGEPWRERLLPYPAFLREANFSSVSATDIAAAFRLTGHFLARHVFSPRGLIMPQARALYVEAATSAKAFSSHADVDSRDENAIEQ